MRNFAFTILILTLCVITSGPLTAQPWGGVATPSQLIIPDRTPTTTGEVAVTGGVLFLHDGSTPRAVITSDGDFATAQSDIETLTAQLDVTDSDLSQATSDISTLTTRATAHAADHLTGGDDPIDLATTTVDGLMPAGSALKIARVRGIAWSMDAADLTTTVTITPAQPNTSYAAVAVSVTTPATVAVSTLTTGSVDVTVVENAGGLTGFVIISPLTQ